MVFRWSTNDNLGVSLSRYAAFRPPLARKENQAQMIEIHTKWVLEASCGGLRPPTAVAVAQ